MSYLCIDIGATKVYIGLLNQDFEEIKKIDTDEFLKDSNVILDEILNNHTIKNMTAALPGPMNLEKNEIYPPNIPSETIDLEKIFDTYPIDKRFINDCHAGVIGEYIYGEEESEDLVYLTISTGIGAGVISDGKLIKGWDENFAEVGHMIIDGDRECGCGGKGHWEAYCSGNNIVDYAEELTGNKYSSTKQLFQSFKDGEKDAIKVIRKFQEINAKGFTNIINLYNPEVIVIGGSLAVNNPEAILEDRLDIIERDIVNPIPKIKITSLENYSVLYGLKAICLGEFDY